MTDIRPTYQIASPSIRPYVQPLWPGALATSFETRDEEGRNISLADDHLSGHSMILVFLSQPEDERVIPLLRTLADLEPKLDEAGATIIVVSASNNAAHSKKIKRAVGFPWPIICDSPGGIFASYGLHKGTDVADRMVLLTPYRQVRAWFDLNKEVGAALSKVMEIVENTKAASEMCWSPPHAPLLVVPNVLSVEECAKLVETVETNTPFLVRRPQPGEVVGNYKMPVYEHHRQDRVDLVIKDQNVLAFLDERLFSRVTPMVQKAFAFNVTRREDLHIARYVGMRQGVTMGHRDNTSPAGAHRRFALSISLNDNYEGGSVVFGEFSTKGYRLPAGSAMVFSSSLLHEVEETTSGVRYNLISHFFNENR